MECTHCNAMFSGGDMAPALWNCPTCGINGKYGIILSIREFAEKQALDKEDIARKALDELNRLSKVYRDRGNIYFCEDRFDDDLSKFLLTLIS